MQVVTALLLLPNMQRVGLADATHEKWNEFAEKCRDTALQFLSEHSKRCRKSAAGSFACDMCANRIGCRARNSIAA